MAYATSNPPCLKTQRVGAAGGAAAVAAGGSAQAGATWYYASADVVADVDAAGYFTNGDDLGMKVGDVVEVWDSTTPLLSIAYVSAVTAGGAATVIALITI